MTLNKVLLIGHLGNDPAVTFHEHNKVSAVFSLATHERVTNAKGETIVSTDWHQVEATGELARELDKLVLKKLARKGAQVYVEGRLTYEQFRDHAGIGRSQVKIRASVITLL